MSLNMICVKNIVKDPARFYTFTRKQFHEMPTYLVTPVVSVKYVNQLVQPNTLSGFDKDILPPLSDLVVISAEMESSKSVGVIINQNFIFDTLDITACKRMHDIKEIKEAVNTETKWFNRIKKSIKSPPGLKLPDHHEFVEKFQNILLNGINHVCADPENPRLLTSDLGLLVSQKWLSLELIKYFLDLLNEKIQNALCTTFSDMEEMHKGGLLSSKIKEWSDTGISTLCLVANVRRKLGKTYFSGTGQLGNHWVCFRINFENSEIIYCDSLAWSPPEKFLDEIKFITSFNKRDKEFTITLGHKNEELPKKVHRCSSVHCLKTPYQGPNQNICGVASLFSAVVLTEETLNITELPDHFKWFEKFYQYNDFCRALLIKWYIQREITKSDILLKMKDETPEMTNRTVDETITDNVEIKKDEGGETSENNNQKSNINGWHLYMHKHLNESSENSATFGEHSKTLKRNWRDLETEDRMEYNMKAKEGLVISPCQLCGATFKQIKRQTEHLKSCGKLFKCDICPKVYNSEKALSGHKAAKHADTFKCEDCSKCFENRSKLMRHQISHKKIKCIECDICGKTFGRVDNMKQHRKNKH